MKFEVRCFGCGREFDFFEAPWCERHRLGAHSKICPHCRRCACGNKPAWDVWRRYQREFRRYGAPRAFDWRRFAVDSLSATSLWLLVWLAIGVAVLRLDTVRLGALLVSAAVSNVVVGGFQGRWMDWFRRRSGLE